MLVYLQWSKAAAENDAIPVVFVKHNKFSDKYPKELVFSINGVHVEIQTDEDGLSEIAKAIADHGKHLLHEAQTQLEKAQKEVERLSASAPAVEAQK